MHHCGRLPAKRNELAGEVPVLRPGPSHEWLCQDPLGSFRAIAKQIDNWTTRLRPEDIEACRAFVEPFGLPYYPAFEPFVKSFSGEEPPEVMRTSR
jgi:hypothetical protein